MDDEDPDIALLLLCHEDHGGDWGALIEALHRMGSQRWQWAIQRCRAMQQLERAMGRPLAALLPFIPNPDVEGAERCSALPPTA